MLIGTLPIRTPREVADRVAEFIPADHSDIQEAREVIYELCLNVLHWAESEGTVFVERTDQWIMITVLDRGVGIPASIRSIHPEATEEEAVALALREGVSTSRTAWRGFGLPAARRLTLREGFTVYLESGMVAVWLVGGETEFSSKSGGAIKGTLVRVIYSRPS